MEHRSHWLASWKLGRFPSTVASLRSSFHALGVFPWLYRYAIAVSVSAWGDGSLCVRLS